MAAQEPTAPTETTTSEETSVSQVEPTSQETPPVEASDKNGKANAEAEALVKAQAAHDEYRNSTEPIFETIMANPDLYKNVYDAHQERLGVAPTEVEDKTETTDKPETPKPSPTETDNRNALVKQTVDKFSDDVGISNLAPEQQKEMNIKVGTALVRMMDPNGNSGKTMNQLINEASLVHLPNMLKDAYFLANREERDKQIAEKAVNQHMQNESGVIGSMPSDSVASDEVTLNGKEREIAKKMNISEEQYLESKKQVVSNRGELY